MKPNRKTDESVSPRQDTYLMLACSQRSFSINGNCSSKVAEKSFSALVDLLLTCC